MLRRRWLVGLAGLAFATTVGVAVLVLGEGRRAAGMPVRPLEIALWQGLIWGAWLPIGLGLHRLVVRLGLTPRMVATLYALGLPTGVAHAGFATALDIAFSPAAEPEDWVRLLLGRTPMDMLVYLALATFAAALVAQQRAAEASAHSAELSRTLDSARAALSARAAGPEPAPRLLVSTGSKQIVVEPGEVEWFASAGNYVVVNWAGREGLIRETLTAVEARLDPAVFARSHRSTIVNLARVRETASLSDGSWRLTVESGAELVVSRTYRDAVLARLRG